MIIIIIIYYRIMILRVAGALKVERLRSMTMMNEGPEFLSWKIIPCFMMGIFSK